MKEQVGPEVVSNTIPQPKNADHVGVGKSPSNDQPSADIDLCWLYIYTAISGVGIKFYRPDTSLPTNIRRWMPDLPTNGSTI